MPDDLRKIPFTEDLLPFVTDFNCGDAEWERPLAAWIKAGPAVKNGALRQMRQSKGKLEVWLHVNAAGEVVGYSSLGESKWPWPLPEDPPAPLSLIPYVAIQKRFWGRPKDDPPRYSHQILEHLKFEARRHAERSPLLGLYVDPRNARAIQAYLNAGFAVYFKKYLDPDDRVEYVSMLLKLTGPAQEAPAPVQPGEGATA